MTVVAFIPFDRKPTKNPGVMICKHFGMKDKSGVNWAMTGHGLRVRVEDFREDQAMKEWPQQVGWDFNWGISIACAEQHRTNEKYIFWHSLSVVLAKAYGEVVVWLDGGTGVPQSEYSFEEYMPWILAEEADDEAKEHVRCRKDGRFVSPFFSRGA